MKNLFLCFALVGMASTLCAQERGDMLVSGSLSWNSSSTKTTVSSTSETTKGSRSFEFTPQFHYFVINKLSVGLGIGYSLEKDPNGRTGRRTTLRQEGIVLFPTDGQLLHSTGQEVLLCTPFLHRLWLWQKQIGTHQ